MSKESARDELARDIFIADNWRMSAPASIEDWDALEKSTHAGQTYCHHIADGLLAAGYRKPRTITTAEEVDALPVGSVVLDTDGFPSRKFAGGWRTMVAEPDGSAWLSGHMEDPEFPVTVLHTPGPA